jgi:hypothetical protein
MKSVSRWEVEQLNDRIGHVKYVYGLLSVVTFKVLSSRMYTRVVTSLPFVESLTENNFKKKLQCYSHIVINISQSLMVRPF